MSTLAGRFTLALLLICAPALAESVRVATLNLRSISNSQDLNTNAMAAAAHELKLLDADIVLLQGVRDWQTCALLAQELKPADYQVAVCSAFPQQKASGNKPGEVGILCKQKAYFSWSEPWHEPANPAVEGGFVFAAFQFGKQRVGVFSASTPQSAPREFSLQQLLDQIEIVRRWEANRVEGFVLGGTFNGGLRLTSGITNKVLAPFEEAGFQILGAALTGESKLRRSSVAQPIEPECFLVDPALLASDIRSAGLGTGGSRPLNCEVELDPVKVAATRTAVAEKALAQAAASAQVRNAESASAGNQSFLGIVLRYGWAVALFAAVVIGSGIRLKRVRRLRPSGSRALLPASVDLNGTGPAAFTLVVSSSSVTGSAAKPPPAPKAVIQVENAATTHTESAVWQRRAVEAERRAERAHEAIRNGVVPHFRRWLKQKFARKLIEDRSHLLEGQQSAARKAIAVDERLAKIEAQIREQNQSYERRVEELTRELQAAKEENRELIRARIAQIKLEMEAARAKLLAQAKEERGEMD